MSNKLLPCPFCGSEGKIDQTSDIDYRQWVHCSCCEAAIDRTFRKHETDDAIQAWNTRQVKTPVKDTIERNLLLACLKQYVAEYTNWEQSIVAIMGRIPNTGVHLQRAKELIEQIKVSKQ